MYQCSLLTDTHFSSYLREFDRTSLMLHAFGNKHMEQVTKWEKMNEAKEEWTQAASKHVSAGGGWGIMMGTAGRRGLVGFPLIQSVQMLLCAFHIRGQCHNHNDLPLSFLLLWFCSEFMSVLEWTAVTKLSDKLPPVLSASYDGARANLSFVLTVVISQTLVPSCYKIRLLWTGLAPRIFGPWWVPGGILTKGVAQVRTNWMLSRSQSHWR